MKKTFTALVLVVVMVLSMGTSLAADTEYCGLRPSGEVIADDGEFKLISIDSNQITAQVTEETVDSNNQIMPLEGGVTRCEPMGLLIYPVIRHEGKATILEGDSVAFFCGPVSGMNYIASTMTQAEQDNIKSLVSNAGFEQIGWYMITGYKVDSYRPLRWSYYEWTNKGQSALKSKAAINGENTFEVVTYLANEPSTSYRFGISGTFSSQSSATAPTSNVPIGLYVTMM